MPADFTILKNKFSPQYLRIFYYYFRVRYKISKFILILKKFYCKIDEWQVNIYAEVAQLVERLPSKQAVASSSLVFRSIESLFIDSLFIFRRRHPQTRNCCSCCSQQFEFYPQGVRNSVKARVDRLRCCWSPRLPQIKKESFIDSFLICGDIDECNLLSALIITDGAII